MPRPGAPKPTPSAKVPELYSRHCLTLKLPGEALFAAMAANIPGMSRHLARETVMAGLVSIDGVVVREAKHQLGATATIIVDLNHGVRKPIAALRHGSGAGAPISAVKPFSIVYEDADFIVVDKAPGVLSAPTHAGEEKGHVPELLRAHWRGMGRTVGFIGLVHRLDLDTSGCLAFALTRQGQRLISAQFAGEAASRVYRCLIAGTPRQDSGTIRAKVGRGDDGRRTTVDEDEPGKDAVTHWKVLRRFGRGAELEVKLETGRTHQIRVHLSEAGMPILGDRLYGPRNIHDRARMPRAPRLMLHAFQLTLDHPNSGKRVTATAPMPPEFAEVAKMLDQDAPPREVIPRSDDAPRFDTRRKSAETLKSGAKIRLGKRNEHGRRPG